jgi:hypothetical protein
MGKISISQKKSQQEKGEVMEIYTYITNIIGPIIGYAFLLLFVSFFIWIFFLIIRAIFSVKVWPGEIVAIYREGSRMVKDIYDKPGRYRRESLVHAVELRLRVDEPVIIESKPVEARTQNGTSAILTIRLTMDVTNSVRYVTAVVGKELEEWREEVLPTLIARVVSSYTITQTLNNREQVAQSIEAAIAAWFAGNRSSDFGLSFKRAAIIEAGSPHTDS